MIENQKVSALSNRIDTQAALKGASAPAFAHHRGYQRMFRQDALSLGIFLPLREVQAAPGRQTLTR